MKDLAEMVSDKMPALWLFATSAGTKTRYNYRDSLDFMPVKKEKKKRGERDHYYTTNEHESMRAGMQRRGWRGGDGEGQATFNHQRFSHFPKNKLTFTVYSTRRNGRVAH